MLGLCIDKLMKILSIRVNLLNTAVMKAFGNWMDEAIQRIACLGMSTIYSLANIRYVYM